MEKNDHIAAIAVMNKWFVFFFFFFKFLIIDLFLNGVQI